MIGVSCFIDRHRVYSCSRAENRKVKSYPYWSTPYLSLLNAEAELENELQVDVSVQKLVNWPIPIAIELFEICGIPPD